MATKKVNEVHSPLFQHFFEKYRLGKCNVEQLKKLISMGTITKTEFEEITGFPYSN